MKLGEVGILFMCWGNIIFWGIKKPQKPQTVGKKLPGVRKLKESNVGFRCMGYFSCGLFSCMGYFSFGL